MPTWKRLLYGVLVAVLVLVGTELLLRALLLAGVDLRVQDPLARDMDRPVLCESGDQLVMCKYNEGTYLQVREQPFDRDSDVPRVVTVGESFVFGLGYGPEDSWPGRLQRDLGDRAEVLNFARCGSESTGLMPTVAAAVALEPAAIVLAIGNNEYSMTPYYSGFAGRHPVLFHDTVTALGRLQLYGGLSRLVGGGLPSVATEALRDTTGHPLQDAIKALHGRPPDMSFFPDRLVEADVVEMIDGSNAIAERLYRARMAQMLDWADARDVPVVLATLPRDVSSEPQMSGLSRLSREAAAERLAALESATRSFSLDKRPNAAGAAGAIELAQAAVAADPKVAFFHYHLGRARWHAGDKDGAIAAWQQARQLDMVPDATPAINAIIRELAAERDLPLVDLDARAHQWLGVQGYYWQHPESGGVLSGRHDGVHVAPEGAEEIAGWVAEAVEPLLP